jgi:hypothetical protein
MMMSEHIGALAAALAKAQATMGHASKTAENPHFRSRYADLAAVIEATRGPLAAQGLAMVQCPFREGQEVGMVTRLLHASGEWIESRLTVLVPQPTAQAVGSALTYLRRYAWQSMVGLAADDDDDGTAAVGPGPTVVVTNASGPRGGLAGEPKPGPTFTVNGKRISTAGIGKDDLLRVWTLSASLEKVAGKGSAKDVMQQTAQVDSSLKLTAADGPRVVAALRDACGAAGYDPDQGGAA